MTFSAIVRATSMVEEPLDRLLQRASGVALAHVDRIDVAPGTGRRTAVLRVTEAVGSLPAEVRIALWNRKLPGRDLAEAYLGAPEFRPGEDVVVVLKGPFENGDFGLEGFVQGKFRVVTDAQGVRRVWSWKDEPEPLFDAARPAGVKVSRPLVTGAEGSRLMTLSDLLNRARASRSAR